MANFGQARENLRLLTMGGLGTVLKDGDTYGSLINRAHGDLIEDYEWSVRFTNATLNTVAPKNTGTVTLTQGQPTVLGTGTNFSYADVGSFLWLGSPAQAETVIVQDVPGSAMLVLSSPYAGPSQVNVGYTLAPRYYVIPGALEVLGIYCQDLELTKRLREDINAIDPTRTDQGGSPSICWCPAPVAADRSQMVELWPLPADYRTYLVDFRRGAPLLVNDIDRPLIPSTVVEEKAAIVACEMMFASTGQRTWLELALRHHETLFGDGAGNPGKLAQALDRDAGTTQYKGRMTSPGPTVRGYDGAFTPSHAIDAVG